MPATALITAIAGLGLAGATTAGVVSAVSDNTQHETPTSSTTSEYQPYGSRSSEATPADTTSTDLPSPTDVPSTVPSGAPSSEGTSNP